MDFILACDPPRVNHTIGGTRIARNAVQAEVHPKLPDVDTVGAIVTATKFCSIWEYISVCIIGGSLTWGNVPHNHCGALGCIRQITYFGLLRKNRKHFSRKQQAIFGWCQKMMPNIQTDWWVSLSPHRHGQTTSRSLIIEAPRRNSMFATTR